MYRNIWPATAKETKHFLLIFLNDRLRFLTVLREVIRDATFYCKHLNYKKEMGQVNDKKEMGQVNERHESL